MFIALGLLSALLYTAAAALLVRRVGAIALSVDSGMAARPVGILLLWGFGVALHSATLYTHIFTPEGMNLGLFHTLSVISWLAAAIVLASALTRPLEVLGVILLPFTALTLILEILFGDRVFLSAPMEPGLMIHVITSLVAYSLLFIAAVQAALLSIQNRYLHNHHPGGYIRALPPLAAMESLLFHLIALGFLLLSLSLLTGFAFLQDLFGQHLAHKTILSIAAWCVFGTLLWGHWRFGWRGRIAARWTLGGFSALLLAYLGSKVVIEIILGR